ncbi:MAG: phosphotransferase [Chloroflexota bacterium]
MTVAELQQIASKITPQWLTRCFHQGGHFPNGEVITLTIEDIQKHHFSLNVIYSSEITPQFPSRLILKWYDHKYAFGVGEGLFYAQIVPAMSTPPVPRCFAAQIGQGQEPTYILLEDVSKTHYAASFPYDNLSQEVFEQVTLSLASIHAHWWNHPRIHQPDMTRHAMLGVAHEAISPAITQQNAQYFSDKILPARIDQLGDVFPKVWQQTCERIIPAWATLFSDRIASESNLTLIQGDAQLGNTMLPRSPKRHRPMLIDWEGCIRGIGAWDLARTLVQTEFSSEKRKHLEAVLLPHYQGALEQQDIKNYTYDACLADYQLCILTNVLHALSFETASYLASAMQAFQDWSCEDLLAV